MHFDRHKSNPFLSTISSFFTPIYNYSNLTNNSEERKKKKFFTKNRNFKKNIRLSNIILRGMNYSQHRRREEKRREKTGVRYLVATIKLPIIKYNTDISIPTITTIIRLATDFFIHTSPSPLPSLPLPSHDYSQSQLRGFCQCELRQHGRSIHAT